MAFNTLFALYLQKYSLRSWKGGGLVVKSIFFWSKTWVQFSAHTRSPTTLVNSSSRKFEFVLKYPVHTHIHADKTITFIK